MGGKLSETLQLGRIRPIDPSAADLPNLHPASTAPATQRRFLDIKGVAKLARAPIVRLDVWSVGDNALATQHPAESAHRRLRKLSSLSGAVALVIQLLRNIQQRASFVVHFLDPLRNLLGGVQPIERLDVAASFVLTLKTACPVDRDCKTLCVVNNVYDDLLDDRANDDLAIDVRCRFAVPQ